VPRAILCVERVPTFELKMDGVLVFSPELHSHLASSFAYVHSACITTEPYTIATFLPPLDETRLAKWWSARFKEAADGHRKIIMQMAPNPNTGEPELAGCVMLHMPETETGPFRGTVEKLLVSPEHRQKGIAKRMMEKLEEVAREEKRTLLVSWLKEGCNRKADFVSRCWTL
jgi:ribosomal protein S18 acetylase RimI-like enzyme